MWTGEKGAYEIADVTASIYYMRLGHWGVDSFQNSLVSLPLQTCRYNRDLWTYGSEIGNLPQPGIVYIKAGPDKRWLLLLLSDKRLLMRCNMPATVKQSTFAFKDFEPKWGTST